MSFLRLRMHGRFPAAALFQQTRHSPIIHAPCRSWTLQAPAWHAGRRSVGEGRPRPLRPSFGGEERVLQGICWGDSLCRNVGHHPTHYICRQAAACGEGGWLRAPCACFRCVHLGGLRNDERTLTPCSPWLHRMPRDAACMQAHTRVPACLCGETDTRTAYDVDAGRHAGVGVGSQVLLQRLHPLNRPL
jgi:hypothetical protein